MSPRAIGDLPVLVSVPHGGTEVPRELEGRVEIGSLDILEDGDAFTGEIYDVADQAEALLKADIARAFVDLNRAEDDRPPSNPDGVVKSHTIFRKSIYTNGREPDAALIERLLERYYRPYHQRIQEIVADRGAGLVLALDCHSMAAVGPDISPDPGQRRPAVCLGNLRGLTSDQGTIDRLAGCFRRVFGLTDGEVTQNRPFGGGYITRAYGGKPLPWIQVELSRDLYLRPPYFDRESLTLDAARVRELNSMFRDVLQLFFRD